jgi:hypothetical protein
MKSLAQIEPRVAITNSGPVTISQSGSYYLTTNITANIGDAIFITASNVMLDLNGFTLVSAANPPTYSGVRLNGALRNITILNGFIQGSVTNNGSGVYGGGGFYSGIAFTVPGLANIRVANVSVTGCLNNGIDLYLSDSTIVDSCLVQTVGQYGIRAATVKNSTAMDCGVIAVYGDLVTDCQGQGYGGGIDATYIAQNCVGYSTNNYGVYAETAIGCYGQSMAGLAGLSASTAAFCTGYRVGGTAIQAGVGNGCVAITGTNQITFKYNMP